METSTLRYGENPHQTAELQITDPNVGWGKCEILQGKELSYNNIADADAAWRLVSDLDTFHDPYACAIIKHANPCGAALGASWSEAYKKALACDPMSAFGGIVAMNSVVNAALAEEIIKTFTEVVIAPMILPEALGVFIQKPNIRVVQTNGVYPFNRERVKSVAGGMLVQSDDDFIVRQSNLNVVTEKKPTDDELYDLRFAFIVAKHVKSNTIVLARDKATIGIGAGQMNRFDSATIAGNKARSVKLDGECVVASDAFFPFKDGLESAISTGATAVIQPGGSMRDQEVIDCANENNISMVFTGHRHFNH